MSDGLLLVKLLPDDYYSLIVNAAFVLSLTSLYVFFPIAKIQKSKIIRFITGVVFGLITVLLMQTNINIGDGALVDARMVIVNIAYLFFGPLVGTVSLVITGLFRIYLGGIGAATGVIGLVLNAAITLLYRKYRFIKIRDRKVQRLVEVFALAFVIRLFYLLTAYILLPPEISNVIIFQYSLWLFVLYPLLTVFFAQILFYSDDVFLKRKMYIDSQESFVLAIEHSPYPIALYDNEGTILSMNEAWLNSTGYETDEFENIYDWLDAAYLNEAAAKLIDRFNQIDTSNYSLDTDEQIIVTKNGEHLIWNIRRQNIGTLPNGKQGYLSIAIDVTEKKKLKEQLQFDNTHDYLTKLYNRRYLDHVVREVLSDETEYCVIFFDLNDFKIMNDKYGRVVGDEVIVEFSKVIRDNISETDYPFRLSGDDFLLITPLVLQKCSELTVKINNDLQKLNIKGVALSTSYGYSSCINISSNFNTAFTEAEDAMYQNKTLNSKSVRGMSINAIMETVKEKDEYTKDHSNKVSRYAVEIAKKIGMTKTQIEEISRVGLLHDIGKILVPTAVLNSTRKLDFEEYEEMKKHPEIGYRILRSDKSTQNIAEYILYHHEKLDGTGYPKGLSGKDIPIQSRIISIADSFDAMTSGRRYRSKISFDEAIKELKDCAGTQFDPELVDAFISCMDQIKSL